MTRILLGLVAAPFYFAAFVFRVFHGHTTVQFLHDLGGSVIAGVRK